MITLIIIFYLYKNKKQWNSIGVSKFPLFFLYIPHCSYYDTSSTRQCFMLFFDLLIIIQFDFAYLVEQLHSLFYAPHITDAEETLVVFLLEVARLDVSGDVCQHPREHLAAIERTVDIAHSILPTRRNPTICINSSASCGTGPNRSISLWR